MKIKFLILIIFTMGLWTSASLAMGQNWPKEISGKDGTIIVYQPQVERFDGNEIEARAAVAVKMLSNDNALEFGAIWMTALVDTEKNSRTVTIRELTISDIRLADGSDTEKQKLTKFLEEQLVKSEFVFSLDAIVADLSLDEKSIDTSGLKHDPPNIIFSQVPAVLVSIDGKPILKKIEGTNLETVANTPFLIVKKNKDYYLSGGGDLWYHSQNPLDSWKVAKKVPKEITALLGNSMEEKRLQSDEQTPPKIIVATVPTELIISDGKPGWLPVKGMGLLYMDNTDSDVFLELSTQKYYVLLSGRWYRSASIGDEWEHIPNDGLPKAFSVLNKDSVNGHILSHVAGTQQARDAVLENTIPQTTAIRRNDRSLKVKYDGIPRFVDIKNIKVQYAVNTESPVFKVGIRYYAVKQGVWYESSSPHGPWIVAVSVPAVIYDIPPSNPHHNVTYVHIYDVTPTVVYVGYTPGYLNSYYYHGTIVYGTGWHYRPWHGTAYYPRPWTWGFHVSFNPWYGWLFGINWINSPFVFSFGHSHHHSQHFNSWYGPAGYNPHYRPYMSGGYRKTKTNIENVHTQQNKIARRTGNLLSQQSNIYDYPQNIKRNSKQVKTHDKKQADITHTLKNNVYADKQGNIYLRDKDGNWQQRNEGKWEPPHNLDRSEYNNNKVVADDRQKDNTNSESAPNHQYQTRPSATRPQLERDYNSRLTGSYKSKQFARSRRMGGDGPPVR